VAAVEAATIPPAGDRAPDARLIERIRAIRSACRQVLGIPDYERYLVHMGIHHPGDPPLSRRDFFARSIDRKYGRSGPRCC
jgi:uncharacterized short protein YbdD (DUF466 family)